MSFGVQEKGMLTSRGDSREGCSAHVLLSCGVQEKGIM